MDTKEENNILLQHRIFRTDSRLSSDEINDFLGIKLKIKFQNEADEPKSAVKRYLVGFFIVCVVGIVSTILLLGSMYQLKIGPFYERTASYTVNV